MSTAAIETVETTADPVLETAEKAVAAYEAGKTTETTTTTMDKTTETVAEPVVEKKDPPRENGKFAVDYSKVTLPKDAAIDADALGRTVAIAREQGLPREQAQAVVDLVNSEVAQHRAALLESHSPGGAEWTKQLDAWKAATLADASLGKTPEERKAAVDVGAAVLKKYAAAEPDESKGIMEFLETSGLGEHPSVAKFFRWLGKAAGERPLSLGTDTTVVKSPGERLYPNMNP